jgi:hypothetical protein
MDTASQAPLQTALSGRPTARQVEAVYAIMRLFRRDPIAGSPDGPFTCDGCSRDRQRDGSVAYGSLTLCNGCATDYELVRLADSARRAETPVP